MTCNLDQSGPLGRYLIFEKDVVALLKLILNDSRQDWPTNGSALALLQYSN